MKEKTEIKTGSKTLGKEETWGGLGEGGGPRTGFGVTSEMAGPAAGWSVNPSCPALMPWR